MKRIVEKHPLAIRWFHWLNFPVLMLMIWSGMLIYWANDVYALQIGDAILVKFFPKWFYDFFDLAGHLSTGMAFHFTFMWVFAINGLLYVTYVLFSGEWRVLVPLRSSFSEALKVTLNDLGIRKYQHPDEKFNGAQRIAYTSIIFMGIGSLLTGLAIYKPIQIGWLTALLGGYKAARVEHFCLTIGFCGFFFVHIAQVVRAGWNNFRAMVAGFEVEEIQEPETPVIADSSMPTV